MLFQELVKNGSGFFAIAFDGIDAGQVQIRLIEARSNANAFFECSHRLVASARAQIQHPEIIERFRVVLSKLQSSLQVVVGALVVTSLREDHGQAVICFGLPRTNCDGALQRLAGFVPTLLLAICIAKIFESDPVARIRAQSLFKTADRLIRAPVPKCEKPEVVPRVGARVRIARVEPNRLLETRARAARVVPLQINASQPVVRFRARRIVPESELEVRLCLIEITSRKESRAKRQMIPPELVCGGVSREWQNPRQPICRRTRDLADVLIDSVRLDWTLVNLHNVSVRINQERCREREV